MRNLPIVNIASGEFKANPYPFYARLRAEAPIHQIVLPDKQTAWLVTRYDDVLSILKDDTTFVKNYRSAKTPEQLARMPWVPSVIRVLERNLLGLDGDDHARLRNLVHKAFTPHNIEKMRARVETLSNELLDAAEQRGQMDIIKDYALPIPLTIISEILGIEEADRPNFSKWSKRMFKVSSGSYFITLIWGIPAMMQMLRLIRRICKERRLHPQDDMITALVQAEESGDHLSDDELLSMVFILLIAGHETTVNLIGSGTLALLENPDQMELLRRKPELTKNAIEELVRYVSPVEQATERYVTHDVTMHGVTMHKGDLLLAVIASANRDESQFEHGDELDITRENIKHLGFGNGIHYCVGAPLARLEGQIAIRTLVQRLPSLHLQSAPSALRWRPGMTVRGLEALPVAL